MSRYETVVLTGSNRGLGLEFCQHYAQHSKRVIACCRHPESADRLNKLAQTFSNVEILSLEVTNQDQIKFLSEHLEGRPVDLLINNAGTYGSTSNKNGLHSGNWENTFAINSIAPILIASTLIKSLSLSSHAVVANITSKMGSISDNSTGGSIIYRSSKAALNAASKSFALDNEVLGITTVLLHPGWVRTDMGGPNGLIDVETSVQGMSKVLENLRHEQNAGFFDYQGDIIPW